MIFNVSALIDYIYHVMTSETKINENDNYLKYFNRKQ
jgi:hypothetical protein